MTPWPTQPAHHSHPHLPLFFPCNAAWMEKPQVSRWDSNICPQCSRPAAAADSCTGPSCIDRSDIPLQPPLPQVKVHYFFTEGRWIRDWWEGHRKGRMHREEAHTGGERDQQKISCRRLDGTALIHFGEIPLFFCSTYSCTTLWFSGRVASRILADEK